MGKHQYIRWNLGSSGTMPMVLSNTEVLLCTKFLVIFFSKIPGLITPCDSFGIIIQGVTTRPTSERDIFRFVYSNTYATNGHVPLIPQLRGSVPTLLYSHPIRFSAHTNTPRLAPNLSIVTRAAPPRSDY